VSSVSVVIPCYRAGESIRRAVASVMAQERQVEQIIIVDDASPDTATKETLAALAKEDLPLQIRSLSTNVGPATARNIGWEMAETSHVAFLDADDSWAPGKIAAQLGWMERHHNIELSGHAYVIAHDGVPSFVLPSGRETPAWRSVTKSQILARNRFTTPTVMVRREIPERFPDGRRYAEDYLLWMRIILRGGRADWFDQPLAALYKRPFGESGLSAHLWRMERGELANLRSLARDGLISRPAALAVAAWSLSKFLVRCGRVLG